MMQAIGSWRERTEIDLLNEESLAGTVEELTRSHGERTNE